MNIKVAKELEFYHDFPLIVDNQYDALLLIKHFCIAPIKRLRKLKHSIYQLEMPAAPEFVIEKIRSVLESLNMEIAEMIHGYRELLVDVDAALSGYETK